jgi:predicted RNase H-like nuclease (RuvC/YqgF family)
MTDKDLQYNLERVQTKIEMIRQESRVLSYKIDRMMEQRKELQAEKRQLKNLVESYNV